MSAKKSLALLGSLLILTANLVLASGQNQANQQIRTQEKAKEQNRVNPKFIDENGDGICDFQRDHDNDGIPNCQDPDWKRPQDGTGYKNRFGRGSEGQPGNRHHGGQGWDKGSFRNGQGPFGNGICDGTGPKGKGAKKGQK